VEAFSLSGQTWRTLAPMPTPRHGTQAIVSNGGLYVAAGSPKRGGPGGATLDLEVFRFTDTAPNQPPVIAPLADRTSLEGGDVSFGVEATDADGGPSPLLYVASGLPAGVAINESTGAIAGTLEPGTALGSPYLVTITVSDGGATDTESFQWRVETGDAPDGAVLYRVNVGGAGVAAADASGVTWDDDTSGSPASYRVAGGGSTYSTAQGSAYKAIDMTHPSLPAGTPESIFTTERYDLDAAPEMTWSFPVESASEPVVVRLFFAEIFSGIDAPGQRVFDVEVEGSVPAAFEGIDPFAEAGAGGAFMREASVTVTDGSLDLTFLHGVIENPAVKAIEVRGGASAPAGNPAALIAVNPGGGLNASTFGGGSFQIANQGDTPITGVEIDLTTALLPDVVFDPVGTAGDAGAKCLEPSSGGALTGFVAPADLCTDPFSQPHNGTDSGEGYDKMSLAFSDFGAGETFTFAVDLDPTSIKGDQNTGDAGSISGLEITGATVTVTFEGGGTYAASLFEDGSLGGSQALAAPAAPSPAPSIAAAGVSAPAPVTSADQTIDVSGPAGAGFTLMQVDARLYIDDPSTGGGYDVDPFEANEALAKALFTGTLDASGQAQVPVTLLNTTPGAGPAGGLNHFVAVLTTGGVQTSATSNVLVLDYDPNGGLESVDRPVVAGWQIVGLPVEPADPAPGSVLASAPPDAGPFAFDETYEQPAELAMGQGFWAYYQEAGTLTLTGTPADAVTLTLVDGWNLIGGPSCAADLASATGDTGVLVEGTFYGFDPVNGYQLASGLESGEGYWVNASAAGQLTLDCAAPAAVATAAASRSAQTGPDAGALAWVATQAAAEAGHDALVLRDAEGRSQRLLLGGPAARGQASGAFAMPPVPPRGVFDARFEGDLRRMEGSSGRVLVRGAEGTLALRLEAATPGARYQVETVDRRGRMLESVWVEAGAGAALLRLEGAEALRVRSEAALPEAFAVRGTSPNPTRARDATLRLDVPRGGDLTVRVYDVLGRAVVDVAEAVAAGKGRALRLPTSRLSAGLYLYRVELRAADGSVERATGRLTVVR
jgi:hypothetical protein